MTYSITARDPQTGQMGVAVQTCNLGVGAWVPWAQAGVGAIATQAVAERTYGTLGLTLLRASMTPEQALTALLSADPRRDFRQVAIVDSQGRTATYTGSRCLPEAGSVSGDGYCTQANMMARNTVWQAMADAYESATGGLAYRLLAALDAAEAEGGDIRGRETAALLVVGPERDDFPLVDLRVDHHPEPLHELRRLLDLHRAYSAEYTIPDLVASGAHDQAYDLVQKIGEWAPGEAYLQFLRALHLAGRLGRWDEGLALKRDLVARAPIWAEYLRRDARVDHFDCLGVSARLLQQITEELSSDG